MKKPVELMYKALAAPFGLAIEIKGQPALSAIPDFNRLRRDAADPALSALVIRASPEDPSHIWLVRRDAQD